MTLFSLLLTLLVTLAIWYWTRGITLRRFKRAYPPLSPSPWTPEDTPFLRHLERSYRLKPGLAQHLPPATSPIHLYLTLYPQHCIYDANENQAFLRPFYPKGTEVPLYDQRLTLPLQTLAQHWSETQTNN